MCFQSFKDGLTHQARAARKEILNNKRTIGITTSNRGYSPNAFIIPTFILITVLIKNISEKFIFITLYSYQDFQANQDIRCTTSRYKFLFKGRVTRLFKEWVMMEPFLKISLWILFMSVGPYNSTQSSPTLANLSVSGINMHPLSNSIVY